MPATSIAIDHVAVREDLDVVAGVTLARHDDTGGTPYAILLGSS